MLAVKTTLRRGGWVVAETPARTVVRLKQLVSLSMPHRLTVFPVQPGLLQLPELKVYISFPFLAYLVHLMEGPKVNVMYQVAMSHKEMLLV